MNPDAEWGKHIAHGVGMLTLTLLGVAAVHGHLTLATMAGWEHDVEALLPVLAGAAGIVFALVGVALLVLRTGRGLVRGRWRYHRRWPRVMADHLLTKREEGRVTVPRLRHVSSTPAVDVLTVRMLPGQSPADWHAVIGDLATAFGAATGRVDATPPVRTDIDLVFRYQRGGGGGDLLALPVGRSAVPDPAAGLLTPPGMLGRPTEVQVRISGWSLHVGWARVRVYGHDGSLRTMRGWWGRVRWVSRWTTAIPV